MANALVQTVAKTVVIWRVTSCSVKRLHVTFGVIGIFHSFSAYVECVINILGFIDILKKESLL